MLSTALWPSTCHLYNLSNGLYISLIWPLSPTRDLRFLYVMQEWVNSQSKPSDPSQDRRGLLYTSVLQYSATVNVYTREHKDRSCLKIMSRTSGLQEREQTGCITPTTSARKNGKRRESHTDGWGDCLLFCLLLFCWITPSFEDWAYNSCSSPCSVMGQRRREIWKWGRTRGGCMCGVNDEKGECYVLWICAEPQKADRVDGGNLFWVVSLSDLSLALVRRWLYIHTSV